MKISNVKTWVLWWLLAAIISCYIRLYPLRAHIWDPTYDQAALMVVFNIRKSLLEEIHAKAPQIPLNTAMQMAQAKLNETMRDDSARVQKAIEIVNKQMFDASGKKPNIYLLESDTFYFYYLTQNIVERGRMADTVKGSKYFDTLMAAPDGYWQPMTYHPYVGFVVYKVMKFFNPDVPLMAAVAYTPLIIILFMLAAFFLTCYTLQMSALAAFVASLFYSLAPVVLKRSALGWYRTDPYNLMFTLLLLAILLNMVSLRGVPPYGGTTKQSIFKRLLHFVRNDTFLFAITITGFAAIWQGWGFMLAISCAILGACGAFSFLQKDTSSLKQYGILGLSLLVAAILGISLLFSFGDFFTLLTEGVGELQKFTVKKFGLWPNLFMEVGELKKTSWSDFLLDSGGLFFLVSGVAGFLYSIWDVFKRNQKEYTLKILALSVFFISTTVMTLAAVRFSIFGLIGLALFVGLGLEAIFKKISASKWPWIKYVCALLLSLFVIVNAQKNIRIVLTPIFNAAWEKSLVDIKQRTPPDSIINTWWPPGHFIKGVAHRKVVFDGATLGQGPTAYWIANILLSTDEKQAAGLLRMLNLSGNKGVEFLTSKGLKTSQAVALLMTIASKTNAEARPFLQAVLNNKDDVSSLLAIIRGGHPHSYVLLYNEIVDQNLGLAFMGRWNIQRVEAINDNPALLASVPARNSAAYLDFLWDLAGGQTHYSPPLQLISEDDSTLTFSENVVVNKSTMAASVDSPTYGRGNLISTVYQSDEKITEKLNYDANLKYAVVVYTIEGQKLARLMDRNLANSLLIKLFFFNASGMEHFKPFTASNDPTGRTQIKVFEVNWN